MKKYNHHTFVLSFILLAYFHKIGVETTAAPKVSISSAENECPSKNRSSVLQTVVLFDVSPENQVDFQQQKDRLIKTLRNIDRFSFGRQRFYELIIFHRTPIDKLQSTNIEEITGQIEGLSMTTIHETSPAKALNEGRSVVEKMPQAQSVILLVHDGHNTDMASETLSASARLSKLKVSIFAIAGGKTPPALAKLADYTGERRRVFAFEQDSQQFLDALDEEIDSCPFPSPPTVTNFAKEKSDDVAPVEQPVRLVSEKPSSKIDAKKPVEIVRKQIGKSNAIVKFECGPANSGKIDLVLLLDTSGSIYHTFDNEVSLVKSILSEMRKPIEDKMLRVSLIHFAERPSMAFSLRDELNRAEMIQKVEQIQFSGGITQICDAIQMGQTELEKFGRNGALKVFVLISDGHGHELWPHTMEIGKKLRQQNIQKFAVSMSTDYSKDELMAYIGDTNRIFVGFRQNLFDSTILAFLNQCVNHPSNSHAENAKGNESSTIAATTSVPSNEAKFTEIPNAQTSADGELTTSSKLPTTEQQNDDSSSATVETSTTDGTTNEQTTNATTETTSPFSDQTTLVNLPEETSQQTTITNIAQTADQGSDDQTSQGNSDQTPSVNVNDNANSTNSAQADQGSGDQTSQGNSDQTPSVNVNDNANSTNPAQNADQVNGVQTSQGNSDQTPSVNVNDNENSTNSAQADQGSGDQTSQGNSDQTPSVNVNDNANSTNPAQNADQVNGVQTSQGNSDQTPSVNVNDNENSTNSAQADQGSGDQTSQGNSDQTPSVNVNDNANSTNPAQNADQVNGAQITQDNGAQTSQGNSDQGSLVNVNDNANSTNSAQNADQVNGAQITQGNSDQTPSVNVNDNANSTNPAQDDQGSGDQTSSVNVNDNANSTNPAQNADHGSGDQTSSVNVNDNANSTNPAQNADQGNGVQTSQGNSDQTPSANVNDNANSTNSAQADQSSGDQTTQGKNDQGSSVNVNDNANSTNSAQNVDQSNGAQITQDNGVQTSQGNSDQGSVNLNVNANSTNPSPTNPTQTADQGNGDQTTQGSGGQTSEVHLNDSTNLAQNKSEDQANSDQTSLKLDNSSNSTSSAQNKSAPIVGGSQDMQNVDDEAKLKMIIMSSLASNSEHGPQAAHSTPNSTNAAAEQSVESATPTTQTLQKQPALPAVDLVIERPQHGGSHTLDDQLPFPDSA